MKKPLLTILTTTYNRGSLLYRCYDSLCKQSNKDFEWIIIDDGSTDNTSEIVFEIMKCSKDFTIRYFQKKNGGKHTALNYSHSYIRGEYVLILDDDDILTEDAVESVLNDWKIYATNKKIGCISYLRADIDTNNILVDWDQESPTISNTIDFRVNAGRNGDCAETIKTSMLLEFPAPEFKNEKFLAEDFLWINSAAVYDTVYIRRVIYKCKYREDGLTKNLHKSRLKCPLGGMYTCRLYFQKNVCLYVKIKKSILYNCYALKAGHYLKHLMKSNNVCLCAFMFPISCLFYLYWSLG